ncbi:hypothetical protein CLF_112271 [Clonorchis sinensis]|uniref:Uncharacterized protein n=1 Tax=Clonorchis sinensis TaxID=79923 RepID=G7YW40_CLOSI|nr:hypothetical protein CLF_112271 [Clonorchis sinensis]
MHTATKLKLTHVGSYDQAPLQNTTGEGRRNLTRCTVLGINSRLARYSRLIYRDRCGSRIILLIVNANQGKFTQQSGESCTVTSVELVYVRGSICIMNGKYFTCSQRERETISPGPPVEGSKDSRVSVQCERTRIIAPGQKGNCSNESDVNLNSTNPAANNHFDGVYEAPNATFECESVSDNCVSMGFENFSELVEDRKSLVHTLGAE